MDGLFFAPTPSFRLRIRGTTGGEFVNKCDRPTHIHVGKRKRVRSFTVLSRVGDAVEAECSLLEKISSLQGPSKQEETSLHLMRTKNPNMFREAEQLLSRLENTSGGFSVNNYKLKSLLPGKWKLVLTNSKAVENNAGSITGLGSLPGAKCTGVIVILGKDGSARTVESIKVFGGMINGENSLEGKWQITGKGILEVTYAQAVLLGRTKLRADSKAVLRTSYCSEKVRLGRSASGEFYVFVRESESV